MGFPHAALGKYNETELLGEIEAKYGVMIPMEQISTIKKLNDFYQYIKES